MAEKRKADGEQATQKKIKIDENDIDFLIGDLLKEEAQLVLTRLLRLPTLEEEIRKNIEIVRHSRNKLTEQQIKQQLVQIEQLRNMQAAAAAMGGANFNFTPSGNFSGFGGAGGAAAKPGVDPSVLRSIKAKIRDAFKKESSGGRGGADVYRVEEGILQGELSNAKEKADRGTLRPALEILQAITEEFIERSSHFEENNVRNYAAVLEHIGKAWIEVFLGESFEGESELSAEDRDTWAEKLRSWNKSAEEESVLNASRWAAKLGWEDEKLKKVLGGELAEAAEFKEPLRLSNERLLILERGKHLKEALNLAKGLELHFQVARFLMKLNQPKDAVEAALKLKNAAEVASIAQIARPIDLESAFSLAIFCLSLQDQSKSAEISVWLVDLAIAENKLKDLVEKLPPVVKSKNTQMQVIRLLKSKAQPQASLNLGRKTLKPYTNEELTAFWHLENPQIPNANSLLVKILPQTRNELLRSISGSDVPTDLCHFMWETAFEVDSASATTSNPTHLADETLEICLQLVEQVQQLHNLMGALDAKKQIPQVLRVGKVALEKSAAQEKHDLNFRRENAIARFKHEQEVQAANLRGEIMAPFVPKPQDHPVFNFIEFKVHVCRTMFLSVLNAKSSYNVTPILGQIQVISDEERQKKVAECNKHLEEVAEVTLDMVQNPSDLLQLATELSNRFEYRLSLRVAQKSFSQVELLDKERAQRQAILDQHKALVAENTLLTNQKLALSAEKAEQLKDLALKVTLFSLLPAFALLNARNNEELFQQIATFNVNASISSQASQELPQRLSPEEIATIVDHSLKFVRNPSNITSLVNLCRIKNEFALVQKIGHLALTRTKELKTRLVQRLAIQAELNLLQSEQQTLLAQKKELSPEQRTRLDELQDSMKPLVPAFYELNTCDAYENLEYSILEHMATSAVQEKAFLQSSLESLPAEAPAEKKTKLQADLAESETKIQTAFEECLSRIFNPRNALNFANALSRHNQIDLVLKAAEHGHACIPSLIDQALTRWDVRRNLQDLQAEVQELAEQRPPQPIPAEKHQQIQELRLQIALWDAEASYQNQSPIQNEQLILDLALVMLQTLQNRQTTDLNRLEQLSNLLMAPAPVAGGLVSQAAVAAHHAAQRSYREEKKTVEDHLASLASRKQKCVKHCLEVISTNPQHLVHFTKAITLVDEPSIELLLTSGKKAYILDEKLDDERFRHSEYIEKIQLIQQESDLLEKFRKKLADDRAAELRNLHREDDKWNYLCTRFPAIPLSDMKRDLANSVLRVLQDHKASLEALVKNLKADPNLATISDDLKTPKKDLEALEYRIRKTQDATDLFLNDSLQFVKSPYDINVLCGLFPSTIPFLYRLVRTGFSNTIELNKLYEERSPVYAEIRKLEAQAEELANVNKQLKKNELDRLAELKHQRFVWDQGAPYKNVRPETREGFKFKMLQSLERALVNVKQDLQGKLAIVEDEKRTEDAQDKMQVDQAAAGARDLKKEIADLREQLKQHNDTMRRYTNEFVAELQDPNHFYELCQNLQGDEEPDLLIQVAKVGHKLMRDLDAQRQKHAEIFRSYFLLLSELYTEKANNNLLHATRQQRLKEAQKEAEEVVPVKYVIHANSKGYAAPPAGARSKKKEYHPSAPVSAGGPTTYPTLEDLAKAASLVDSKDIKFNEQPVDWSIPLTNGRLEELIGQTALLMVTVVINEKKVFLEELQEREKQGLHDPEKGDSPEVKVQKDTLQLKLEEMTRYAINEIRDFHGTLAILNSVRDEGEPKLVLMAGEKALQQLNTCRQACIDNEEPLRELKKLNDEKEKQLAQRSSLPEQEQLRLLELQFQQNLLQAQPRHLRFQLSQYQRTISETLSKMMQVAYLAKEVEEKLINDMVNAPRLVRGVSMTSVELEERSKKGLDVLETDIDLVITLCTKYLSERSDAHRFVNELNNQYRDFKRLLTLGAFTQQILKTQLEIQERYEALMKKKLELEAKQISGAPPSEELLDLLSDLEELEPKIGESSSVLRNWILDVAELMIDSARIEKQEQVVLEQIVLVFKMKMTHDKFEEVKNLTAPKDWPAVRKDLLNYVAKHDTTLPGSPISLKEQLELLLREGLCDESIKIFPDPEPNDFINSQRIEILELLWFEVERQQPVELERILPLIEKYAKKEYQQFKITSLDRLFDAVQLKYPDFMKGVFSRGSEILIGNLPATKYNVYCQFLKALKKRLTVDLKAPQDWDAFIKDVRKEHGRKKKLIQMLNIEEL